VQESKSGLTKWLSVSGGPGKTLSQLLHILANHAIDSGTTPSRDLLAGAAKHCQHKKKHLWKEKPAAKLGRFAHYLAVFNQSSHHPLVG
jgi:hypothetical protein